LYQFSLGFKYFPCTQFINIDYFIFMLSAGQAYLKSMYLQIFIPPCGGLCAVDALAGPLTASPISVRSPGYTDVVRAGAFTGAAKDTADRSRLQGRIT
jgi:hypothetical protein